MADAVVIQVAGETAGIAVADAGGYRFFASSRRFFKLDNTLHRSIGATLGAARTLHTRLINPGTAPSRRRSAA
ncbi:MAG: hypothetical protein RLY86_2582 [Pseudomonadota bacterium]|jgi:hypothetical protein